MNESKDDVIKEKVLEDDNSVQIRDKSTSSVGNILNVKDNAAKVLDNTLQGNFVSKNVVNLSQWNHKDSKISLLSKAHNFVPFSNKRDKEKPETELVTLGRLLRLTWHYRNEESEFDLDQFKSNSTFNSHIKDAVIEV